MLQAIPLAPNHGPQKVALKTCYFFTSPLSNAIGVFPFIWTDILAMTLTAGTEFSSISSAIDNYHTL